MPTPSSGNILDPSHPPFKGIDPRTYVNGEGNGAQRLTPKGLIKEWDLLGLTREEQVGIDAGIRASLWTPLPIGLKLATHLQMRLAVLKGQSPIDVANNSKIIAPTAGAGGSTIALCMAFQNVRVGDFCPRQLQALKHNIHDVMKFKAKDGIVVERHPINVLNRDLKHYDAVLLEPLWGGTKYKQALPGAINLYIPKGTFNESTMDNVARDLNFKHRVGWEYNKGTEPLHDFITRTMKQGDTPSIMAVLLPYNYDTRSLHRHLRMHGLHGDILDPHSSPPVSDHALAQVLLNFDGNHHDQGGAHIIRRQDLTTLHHFPRYTGPDRYVFVSRANEWSKAKTLYLERIKAPAGCQLCSSCMLPRKVVLGGGFSDRNNSYVNSGKIRRKLLYKPRGWNHYDQQDKDDYFDEAWDADENDELDEWEDWQYRQEEGLETNWDYEREQREKAAADDAIMEEMINSGRYGGGY